MQRGHPILDGTLTSGTCRLLTCTPRAASRLIASCQEPAPIIWTGHPGAQPMFGAAETACQNLALVVERMLG